MIFVDWTSSSFAHINHVGIVTGMKGGEPIITQHTPSQRGVTLHYWETHPPALVHGRPNVHVWSPCPTPTEVARPAPYWLTIAPVNTTLEPSGLVTVRL